MRHLSTLFNAFRLGMAKFGLSVLIYSLLGSPAYGVPDEQIVQAALVDIRGVNFFGGQYPISTGFVVSADGHVLTVGQEAIRNAPQDCRIALPGSWGVV